jgi:hypothetical protein
LKASVVEIEGCAQRFGVELAGGQVLGQERQFGGGVGACGVFEVDEAYPVAVPRADHSRWGSLRSQDV